VEGYPSGVKFTSTNQSSITINASDGVATMVLASKNWVGIAKVRVKASEGLEEELTADILIPVVPNKNLEIFLLYKNELNDEFMKYYNPADGSFEGEWIGNITYGKFCVDSDNNLYFLDENKIIKKNSVGVSTGTSEVITSGNYAINSGPNGYIYFTQDTGTEGSPAYCINKINPNTLTIEDILNLTPDNLYYGFAVDFDGSIYIHNNSDDTIEKWNFKDGFIKSSPTLPYNYDNSELAIAGNYIGGIGIVETGEPVTSNSEAFIIKKDLNSFEPSIDLSEIGISTKTYISSVGGDFLICGINASGEVVFGRYSIEGSSVIINWKIIINDQDYLNCIIGSYPF